MLPECIPAASRMVVIDTLSSARWPLKDKERC
jgi:hypothetical protein